MTLCRFPGSRIFLLCAGDQDDFYHARVQIPAIEEKRRPRVLILGGGFAGTHAAISLEHLPVEHYHGRSPESLHFSAVAIPGGSRRAFSGEHCLPDPHHCPRQGKHRSTDGRGSVLRYRRPACPLQKRNGTRLRLPHGRHRRHSLLLRTTTSGRRSPQVSRASKMRSKSAAVSCLLSSWPNGRCSKPARIRL